MHHHMEEPMKSYKFTALFGAVLIIISGLFLISADGDNKPITLVFWSSSEQTIAPGGQMRFADAVREFEEKNPGITIIYKEKGDYSDYKRTMQSALSADTAPDVFTTHLGISLTPHIKQGKVLALDAFLTSKTKNALLPAALYNVTQEGHIYALPFRGTVSYILCNTEIFEQNKLSYPQTFAELVSLCKKLKSLKILPFAQSTESYNKWVNLFFYETLALRHGGYKTVVENGVKNEDFGDSAFLEAARDMKALTDAGAFPEDKTIQYTDAIDLFFRGGAAMYYGGTWILTLANANKRLITENKIKAIRFPVVSGGKGDIKETWGGAFMGLAVSGRCPHKKEAVRFIEFLGEYIADHASTQATGTEADISLWKAYIGTKAKYGVNSQINALALDSSTLIMGWDVFMPESVVQTYWNNLDALVKGTITPEKFYASLPGNRED